MTTTTYPRTDAGNAACLEHLHRDRLRFVHGVDRWRLWNGRHWADEVAGEADRLALDITAHRLQQAAGLPEAERDRETRWALTSGALARRRAALACAASSPAFASSPEDYDRDPFLLNVANGILDLRTGDLRPHDPAALLHKLAPVEYQPDAACPRWEDFLHEVFLGDADLVAFAHRLAGYLLTGDTREQAAFFLVGNGANGKTVFVETLRALLGTYAADTPASVFLGTREAPADLAPLLGARLVTASEGAGTQGLNEALLKRVTGGDPVTCRPAYRDPFSYSPAFKLLFPTNEVPRFASQSYALKRRLYLLPFRQTFYRPAESPAKKGKNGKDKQPIRDEALRGKLAAELPGLLAWAVRGSLEWQRAGLCPPAGVLQETDLLFRAMDPLADFLTQDCYSEPKARVETGALWKAYNLWCTLNDSPRAFNSAVWLSRHLLQREGITAGRKMNLRYLVGIGLIEHLERSMSASQALKRVLG